MAAEAAGSLENVEYGFTPDDSGVITFGSGDQGFIDGDVAPSLSMEFSYLELDQSRVDVNGICVKKELSLGATMSEALLETLQDAMNEPDTSLALSVLSLQDTDRGSAALVINSHPPNDTGVGDTRVWNIANAVSIGPGVHHMPANAKQTVEAQWRAIAAAATGIR